MQSISFNDHLGLSIYTNIEDIKIYSKYDILQLLETLLKNHNYDKVDVIILKNQYKYKFYCGPIVKMVLSINKKDKMIYIKYNNEELRIIFNYDKELYVNSLKIIRKYLKKILIV